jgi:CBS domain-containing protein
MRGLSVAAFEPLPSLIEVAENALTVMHLAAEDLAYVEPDQRPDDALAFLEANGFDAAPVAGDRPDSFVDVVSLRVGAATVEECARSLDAPVLVTSTLGLADGVRLLGEQPYFFVIDGHDLAGIVTRADLQRQSVSMVVLSMILASEMGMNRLIPRYLSEEWMSRLPDESALGLLTMYERRVLANAEISHLDCLMLHQRLDLLRESEDLMLALGGTSRSAFKTWKKRLVALRDVLAHGGGLLHAESDPVRAIDLFDRVRGFAERVWEVATQSSNEPVLMGSPPKMLSAGDPWTEAELEAAVEAYDKMLEKERAGQHHVKAEVRRSYLIGPLRARSDRSFEERMGNISAIREQLGLPTIPGYKPKPHVGSGRSAQLVAIIHRRAGNHL